MDRIRLKDKTFELFIPDSRIQEAIGDVARRIEAELGDLNPLLVGILNGAFMFTAELIRALNGPYEVTFARYSSYAGTATTGVIQEIMPISTPVEGRTVVLLEDIIDTGFTMSHVMRLLRERGAADVRLATLLFKPESLRCDLRPDYVGLTIPPAFIVGHGLDYDGLGRSYRDIYQVVGESCI
ncbi:MAG: phosphoribosyltransferase [Parabacteroides sp.]